MVSGVHWQGAVGKVFSMNSHKEDMQGGTGQRAAHAFSQQPRAEGKLNIDAAEGENGKW